MNRKYVTFFVALTLSLSVSAETLTFDGMSSVQSGALISNGYGDVTWDNFYVLDTSSVPTSGYANGVISGQNVAFNGYGNDASFSKSTLFTLGSGFFTGAWENGLTINVTGVGINNYFTSFVVNTDAPINQVFNWKGLSSVKFSTISNINYDDLESGGKQFALDNLIILNDPVVSTPEPSSLLMIILGLLGLGFIRKRSVK